MTLQARCEVVIDLLGRHADLQVQQKKADEWEARRRELAEPGDMLASLVEQARLLVNAGILAPKQVPPLVALGNRATTILEAFRQDTGTLTKGQGYALLKRQIESLRDKFSELVNKTWKEFIDKQVPVMDQTILERYMESGQYQTQIDQINQLQTSVAKEKQRLPTSREGLDALLEQIAALSNAHSQLQGIQLPEEVMLFLREAKTSRGAKLDRLTPVVLDWLRENGSSANFKIVQCKS